MHRYFLQMHQRTVCRAWLIFFSPSISVSPSISNPTLQSLLTSPTVLQGAQLGLPAGVQIVTVSSPSDILPNQSVDMDGRVWHVLSPEQAIIAVGDVDLKQGALVANPGMRLLILLTLY